jgi:hypothetical protein
MSAMYKEEDIICNLVQQLARGLYEFGWTDRARKGECKPSQRCRDVLVEHRDKRHESSDNTRETCHSNLDPDKHEER